MSQHHVKTLSLLASESDPLVEGVADNDEPTLILLFYFVQMLADYEPSLTRKVMWFCRRPGATFGVISDLITERLRMQSRLLSVGYGGKAEAISCVTSHLAFVDNDDPDLERNCRKAQ